MKSTLSENEKRFWIFFRQIFRHESRVTMKPGSTMRVARPTDNLGAIAEMYAKGLGFAVLAEFKDHRGFDKIEQS
jgi:hypothetical protein